MALFVQLDVNWPDHDKVIAVGLAGAGLHATAMALAKRTETDGVLSRALLTRYGATPDLIDLLVAERLFDVVDDRRVAVHGWLDRNPAVSDYSAAARAGNHKRWNHPGPVETCDRCNPEIAPDSPPTRPDIGGDNPDPDPTPTPPPVDNPAGTVDNPSNGEYPRSVAIDRGAIAPESPPDSPRSRPRVLETESETETETGGEQQHDSRAKPPPPTGQAAAAATLTAAVDIITTRRLATHPTRPNGNPDRHRASIHAGITRDRATDAWTYLHTHPHATPTELANHLEPPTPTDPGPNPRTPTTSPPTPQPIGTPTCPRCGGSGMIETDPDHTGHRQATPCPDCSSGPAT